MVDVTAIGVVAHSLNTAVNIAKAMIYVRDATALRKGLRIAARDY